MNWKLPRWWERLSTELLSEAGSLGVYLDGAGLTLAHVQKSLAGLQVQHLMGLPLGAGRMEDLAPRLKETISPWGLNSCPVSLAVSGELGFCRQVTLPRAAAENLAQVVAYELDRFLPLPGDRLYFDFQVLEETDAGISLMLMALPRETVEACLHLLREAGLSPISVELAPGAVANAFALLGGRLPASWLLLHLEADGLELTHIQGRTLWASRQVRLAPAEDVSAIVLSEIQRLGEQGHDLKGLCLYGSRLSAVDVAAVIEPGDLAVVTPDLLTLTGLPLETDLATALPAVGTALRGLGKVPLGGNLLPAAERVAVSLGGFSILKLLLAVFLGLSCLWAGSLLIHKRVLLYQVNSQLELLAPEARQVEGQLEESRGLAKQLQSFQRMEQAPNKLRILKQLTQLIPDHTWLFHLRISQQTLEISGMSKSAADLIPLLEKSGWLTKTEFASPIVTDASKFEHFKIKAEIKGLELGS